MSLAKLLKSFRLIIFPHDHVMRGPLQQLRLKINVAVYNNDVEGRRGFNGQKYIFEEFTLDN